MDFITISLRSYSVAPRRIQAKMSQRGQTAEGRPQAGRGGGAQEGGFAEPWRGREKSAGTSREGRRLGSASGSIWKAHLGLWMRHEEGYVQGRGAGGLGSVF